MAYIYVAGPLTQGNVLQNIRKAIDAAEDLRRAGHKPFVPHAQALWEIAHTAGYEDWMEYDLAWLLKCDALVRLNGHSPGADREVAFAHRHNIPVFTSTSSAIAYFAADLRPAEEDYIAEIREHMHHCSPDAWDVLLQNAAALGRGEKNYGVLDLDTDDRNMLSEAVEEARDLANYLNMKLIQMMRKEKS